MIGVANELLIEFYRTVVSDPIDVQSKDPRKYIPSKDLPDDFLSQQFLLEELQSAKSIQWLIPVRDPSCNKKIGTLSCCAYPGYERYRKEYYGNLRNLPKNQKNNDFIAISLQGENLYTIVFEQNGFFQTKYPWNLTRISYEI
jgi:hypothetical protein